MDSWSQFSQHQYRDAASGIQLDYSQMGLPEGWIGEQADRCENALQYMQELEAGAIKNVSEGRMVGHYWLRDAASAPDQPSGVGEASIAEYVNNCRESVQAYAREIHESEAFTHVLVIGIGGSALGPQLVADALGSEADKLQVAFMDNTDPDGFERVLGGLPLASTLVLVISKSGGTKETANGMAAAQAAFRAADLSFEAQAVAVTGPESKLDKIAQGKGGEEGGQPWRRRFAMTDWVGGRTSVTSVVGLLPMALQGLDTDRFLEGARAMDAQTREPGAGANPAMLLALMWHHAGGGLGQRDMVILPYKDRLALMAKYLQQLIMESLGKAEDLKGQPVAQGIAVYGNKGSTDQHAYVQQLRDGVDNFFATFLEIRESLGGGRRELNEAGDYLQGFLRGTRRALADKGRPSLTLSLPRLDAATLGALIALYERAVGFYAVFVDINAYDQPGVEAGKIAAEAFIHFLKQSRAHLGASVGEGFRAEDVMPHIEAYVDPKGNQQDPTLQDVYHGLVHMASNDPGVEQTLGASPAEDSFCFVG